MWGNLTSLIILLLFFTINLERVSVDLQALATALQPLIEFPLLPHLRRGWVHPSEFQIELLSKFFDEHMHLYLFDHDHEPRIVVRPG